MTQYVNTFYLPSNTLSVKEAVEAQIKSLLSFSTDCSCIKQLSLAQQDIIDRCKYQLNSNQNQPQSIRKLP